MNQKRVNMHKLNEHISAFVVMSFVFFAGLYFMSLSNTGLFDVDEAIFAEASSEMLETRDFVTPQYNGDPRYHKPPLIYWLQAASMDYFGKGAFAARLPSAIFAFLAIFGFYVFISGMTHNRRLAITASVILGANLSFLIISQAATADMALNFFVLMATLGFIANLYAVRRSPIAPAALGVVLGLAMLAKGPVSLMVPFFVVGTAVLLKKNLPYNLKCVNPIFVIVAMCITLVPWLQFIIDAKGMEFFHEFIFVHNLGRFTQAMGNTQSGSHFYYIAVLMFGFFPWVLFLPSAIYHAAKNFLSGIRSDKAQDALPSLGLVWFLSIFVFFSFSATKLPHYIIPAYAGAALMIAARFEKMWDEPFSKWNIVWMAPIVLLFSVIFAMFKYVPDILLGRFEKMPTFMQKFIGYLQSDFGLVLGGIEDQTRWMLSENVIVGSAPLALGLLALMGITMGVYFIFKRQRAGVVWIGVVTGMILLLISCSVVPTVYKFTQLPLAQIGEKINMKFDREKDKLYFIAIHQPSVRFVSGVPFTSLSTSAALMQEKTIEPEADLWFVLKQERLENLKKYIPEMWSEIDCKGGYCLAQVKMKDVSQYLTDRQKK
mgnify:CR=1 FL=1|tara:strand:- start:113441 stop:115243 length:1803 start_codon:yes stop_codon:yes gene_type:complete